MSKSIKIGIILFLLLGIGLTWKLQKKRDVNFSNDIETPPEEHSSPLESMPTLTPTPPTQVDTKNDAQQSEKSFVAPPAFGPDTVYSGNQRYSLGSDSFWELDYQGLPLMGFRYFPKEATPLPPAPKAPHSRAHKTAASEKVRELLKKKNCEIFTIKDAVSVWFQASRSIVVPAYSVEAYALCQRDRRREDWILSEPDLRLLSNIKKPI